LYFERESSALGFGSRGSGKTIIIAVLNCMDMWMKAGVDIACAASTLDQTIKGYRYSSGFLMQPEFRHLLTKDPTQSATSLKNGSFLEITTGTKKGLNSPHPIKARIDEVELIDWEVLQEGLSMSMSKPALPWKSQDVFTSTRKTVQGTMQRLLNESSTRGIKVYSWCIWEVVERCNRDCKNDPVHGDCPLAEPRFNVATGEQDEPVCGGKAHSAFGWYPISDYIRKARVLDRDTYEAQWENKKPAASSVIYGSSFSEAMHEVNPFPIPTEWQVISGIDFGANFAYLKFAVCPRTRILFGFFEYFSDKPLILDEHVKRIKGSPLFRGSSPIYAGIRGIDKQPFIEFRHKGLPLYEAEQDVLIGISKVKAKLQQRIEFMFPNGVTKKIPGLVLFKGMMPVTKSEFENWGYEMNADGTPNYDEPQKYGDHCMSAVRYAVYTWGRRATGYRSRKIAGLG
jgi:hypothetical protein